MIGHSYGSTVVGHAASGHDLPVDDVIFVGSPGVGVDHASELNLEPGQVWSSHAENDVIRRGMVHGRNPSDPDFGGQTFTSDPGTPMVTLNPGPWNDPLEGDNLQVSITEAHSEYWDYRSTSLDNMVAITTNNDELVR